MLLRYFTLLCHATMLRASFFVLPLAARRCHYASRLRYVDATPPRYATPLLTPLPILPLLLTLPRHTLFTLMVLTIFCSYARVLDADATTAPLMTPRC